MPGGAFLPTCPPEASPGFELVALGLAIVANEKSRTEPTPRIPQINESNERGFETVAGTPRGCSLGLLIRKKYIRSRWKLCDLGGWAAGTSPAVTVNFTHRDRRRYCTLGQKGGALYTVAEERIYRDWL